MSDRQRHRAFAGSVLFAIAICVLVWLVERPGPRGVAEATPTTQGRRPLVLGSEAPAPTPPSRPHRREAALSGKAAIVETARRFTRAFVKYEVGQLPARVRRAIQSTATPSFASSLLSAPPRIPQGVRPPSPAQVRSVALANGPQAGQAAAVAELRASGGEASALTELLSRSGREWRISGLG